jgi:hypothetical protein
LFFVLPASLYVFIGGLCLRGLIGPTGGPFSLRMGVLLLWPVAVPILLGVAFLREPENVSN